MAERLNAINARFYETHAESFADTRTAPWPGWEHAEPIREGRVLDLGCGNGRYLHFLHEHGFVGAYLGVDSCAPLVQRATSAFPPAENLQWRVAGIDALLANDATSYERVVAWGVLHHVPSEAARTRLIESMLRRVAPGGTVWFSLWQFRNHPRFEKNECAPSNFGIDAEQLEVGDALLDWQGNRDVPRYCHHFSDEEIERVSGHFADYRTEVFRSDAGSDRFNVYLSIAPD